MLSQILKTALCLLLMSTNLLLFGQEDCKCCSENHQQFDFWIGTWEVFDTIGNKVGENEISEIENGCALMEKWKGLRGGTGTSINFYNQKDSTWNQLWVSSNGGILKLKGAFENDQMILKSEPFLIDSTLCYNQIIWSKTEKGVRQKWDIFENSGKLRRNIFTGVYIKKE